MTKLVADIGGTNMRIAIADGINAISNIRKYQVTDYASPVETIEAYIKETGIERPTHVCLAIACPVNGDQITMTNHSWSFSIEQSQKQLGVEALFVINDFTAIALSVPFLTNEQKIQLGGESAEVNKPIAVYGAGTGLGVAHVIAHEGKWIALGGEGGHVDFAPNNQQEAEVLSFLAKEFGHVSAERLMSGQGIANIYRALAAINNAAEKELEPSEITSRALANSCSVCKDTLDMFCNLMGSFGGNLALTLLTQGGVFIAGGIVPRFIEYFVNSGFRQRFEAKGRFEPINKKIPVYIVTEEQPGLLGAAAYLAQNL
ncbi:glucokinase [Catenovulum sp. 2E275]|uniref:glucokinase n=1 Tax=Catenovulum sp. 2E275 TaxID=2980497 RepID=UPI0021D00070|nr:glucokinase [Catenovulum sp. 2E275]MCU4677366.1 glucokinase [Catenovulum sp. 2E275]